MHGRGGGGGKAKTALRTEALARSRSMLVADWARCQGRLPVVDVRFHSTIQK